jgi:peptidoglycan/xylan/chitin deacetylase (PgdA/CDA1 family)
MVVGQVGRVLVLGVALVILGACAAAPPQPAAAPPAPAPAPPTTAAPAAPGTPRPSAPPAPAPAPVEPLPDVFESDEFVVVMAKADDTPEGLARRFLGDPGKAWMITDYNGTAAFTPGREVIIPKRPWNLSGVEPDGYQLVPILCYHNFGPQSRGRLVLSASAFEEQMRYLEREGYHVITLGNFLEYASLRRQLPRKTVVLTFDDGWRSFKDHAYPILKELGFPATLFVYTDFIGARVALSWQELKELADEGFDIQAHSKTHGDMRRKPGEPDAEYAQRLQGELVQPLALFQRRLGRTPTILAYPYGSHDEDVLRSVREAGYVAALDVRRQGNPSFTPPFTVHRAQIYSEMTLEDFARNLTVFSEEPIR